MNYRKLYPKEYLAAEDLMGKEVPKEGVTLTVSRLVEEKVQNESGSEVKPVLYFREMEERARKNPDQLNRRLVLGLTNARTISRLYGPETEDWVGKRITLYATTCNAFGDPNMPCIRIRQRVPPAPKRGQPEPEPDVPDQEPPEPEEAAS